MISPSFVACSFTYTRCEAEPVAAQFSSRLSLAYIEHQASKLTTSFGALFSVVAINTRQADIYTTSHHQDATLHNAILRPETLPPQNPPQLHQNVLLPIQHLPTSHAPLPRQLDRQHQIRFRLQPASHPILTPLRLRRRAPLPRIRRRRTNPEKRTDGIRTAALHGDG